MATYQSSHTGAEIDAAVAFGKSPDTAPVQGSTKGITSGAVYTALQNVQPTITMDDTVTQNSSNPVKSSGIYTALAGKQNTLTFDNSPQSGSSNPVKSSGIYTALQGKQDTLTIDAVPTNGSSNPVSSDGVYDAIRDTPRLNTQGLSLTRTALAVLTNVATKNIPKGDFFFLAASEPKLCKAIRHIAAGDVLSRFSGSGTPSNTENYIEADESPATYFFQPMAGFRRAKKWVDSGSTRVFTMTEIGGASNVLITYGSIKTSSSSDPISSYGVYILYYTGSAWTVVPLIEGTNHPTVAIDSNHTLTVTYSNVYSAQTGNCVLINLNMFPQDYV